MSNLSEFDLSRRKLLQGVAKGAVMAALPTWFVRNSLAAEAENELQRPRRVGPNDTIAIAVIGPGGPRGGYRQGFSDANAMHHKHGAKVIAVCDVDGSHCDWAAQQFGPDTRKYHDYRELLQNKNIDAVVIGTPDHWHSTIAIDAMNAGKDVYCEKPLTLTIQQGIDLVAVADQTRAIFQTGSQQRSDARFRLACELVRNGRVGKMKTVTCHLPTGPIDGPFESSPIPSDFDWNFWVGPAPMTDYIFQRTHGDFRWWLEYSGGMLTDWGAHHNDIAQWALGMDASGPMTVRGTAKNQPTVGPNVYSAFPEYHVEFLYSNEVILRDTSQGENGVTFEGEDGWIFVSRRRIGASDPKLLDEPLAANATRLTVSNDHQQNFLDGIRSRKPAICTAEIGHRSATVCHLANICLRLQGRKLEWDAANERFLGNVEAQAMLSRPVRKWS